MVNNCGALNENFKEIEEPSLQSSDPNERKFARQLRIQKRAEALQKLFGHDLENVEETLTEKQIRTSAENLDKLIRETGEVITNVRIANDAREIERQKNANEIYDKLLKRIEESKEECEKKYNIINEQWPKILKLSDPIEINDRFKSQLEKCDQVLAQKDEIIEALKQEIARADNVYLEDQKKQKDDIKLLIERIDYQMDTLENAYSRELQTIDKVLKDERNNLVKDFQKKWEVLYKKEQDEDHIGDEKLKEVMREHEEEMEKVRTQHDEDFREQQIRLDKECQSLEQQVEKTKAQCMLNTEKLSYNFTVLKNREEENTILKSKQKRTINKLQGIINTLKQNYSDLEISSKLEKEKLAKQILKAHQNILSLEEKCNLFTRVNEKQYLDIWDMNTKNANQLVEKILAADKLIHERTLGILWEPPQKTLPKKEDMPSYRKAIEIIEKRKQEEAEAYKMFEYEELDECSPEAKLEKKVLNNILKQISSCSTYLIEDKLKELLSHRSEEEKTIIQLDNVFQALSIYSPEEINMLLNFFMPYAYCFICSGKEESIISETSSSSAYLCDCHLSDKDKKLIDIVKEETETVLDKNDELNKIIIDLASESSLSEEEKNIETKATKFTCDKGHILEIQTAHVTRAIKDIVEKYSDVEQKNKLFFEERLKGNTYTISRNISAEDVKSYWSQYREIFGEEKEKLWDSLLVGLNQYYELLMERHNICKEIETLKKQNAEFQQLLRNQELCPKNEESSLQEKPGKNQINKLKMKT